MFWTLVASKQRIEQLNFFDWLSNVKNLVLSNGLKHVRNVIKIAFFSQKHKNRPAAGGSAPRPPFVIPLSTLAYSTRLLSCSLLNTSQNLSLHQNPGQVQTDYIFQFTISLPHKNFFFENF